MSKKAIKYNIKPEAVVTLIDYFTRKKIKEITYSDLQKEIDHTKHALKIFYNKNLDTYSVCLVTNRELKKDDKKIKIKEKASKILTKSFTIKINSEKRDAVRKIENCIKNTKQKINIIKITFLKFRNQTDKFDDWISLFETNLPKTEYNYQIKKNILQILKI